MAIKTDFGFIILHFAQLTLCVICLLMYNVLIITKCHSHLPTNEGNDMQILILIALYLHYNEVVMKDSW